MKVVQCMRVFTCSVWMDACDITHPGDAVASFHAERLGGNYMVELYVLFVIFTCQICNT